MVKKLIPKGQRNLKVRGGGNFIGTPPDMSDRVQPSSTRVAVDTQPRHVVATPEPVHTDPDILVAELKTMHRPLTADDYQIQGINVKPYEEGVQRNGEVNLPEVVVTAEQPKSYTGIPVDVYHSDLSRRMYEDRNKAGRDIALGMTAIAAPELGPVVNGLGKLMTPSTYISRAIPWLTSEFGISVPTTATSLIGAGADMAQAGYFAHEGYKGVKEALQHPENLQSWTDYGKLGLDAAMMFGPFSQARRTVSALSKVSPYINEGLIWTGKKLYPKLNPVARALSPYRWLGYESKLKKKAEEGIQESMDIFNKYHKGSAENIYGKSIELGKPSDYLQDIEYSYLPWDSRGKSLSFTNGYSLDLGDHRRMLIHMPTLLDPFSYQGPKSLLSTAVHEGNHNFVLDPILDSKYPMHFGFGLPRPDLNKAYMVGHNPVFYASGTPFEKAAVNAQIRNQLGLTSEEINNLPIEKFIYKNWRGKPVTIFDKLKWKINFGYMEDYANGVREALKTSVKENLANGGKGMSDVFPNFAKDFAENIKRSLIYEYKYGGKLLKQNRTNEQL